MKQYKITVYDLDTTNELKELSLGFNPITFMYDAEMVGLDPLKLLVSKVDELFDNQTKININN